MVSVPPYFGSCALTAWVAIIAPSAAAAIVPRCPRAIPCSSLMLLLFAQLRTIPRGSRRSRRESPKMFTQKTIRVIARPGAATIQTFSNM